MSLRVRLILLISSVLIPVVLFAGVLLWWFASSERDRLKDDALDLAQRVSLAVDRELTGLTAALEALATSPALSDGGNFAVLDAQARALLQTRGSFIAMRDRNGQQLINTSRPFGAALLVSRDPVVIATDREVFEKGRPVISDLYTGAVTGLRLILIDAPVVRDGLSSTS